MTSNEEELTYTAKQVIRTLQQYLPAGSELLDWKAEEGNLEQVKSGEAEGWAKEIHLVIKIGRRP